MKAKNKKVSEKKTGPINQHKMLAMGQLIPDSKLTLPKGKK